MGWVRALRDDARVTTPTNDLARARERLVELDRERTELCRAIAELEFAAGGPDVTTADGRVALFTSLFRGRSDVFATRWESTKGPGKTGRAPRCLNEWRPGVCEKPKVKCADCGNRRFVAWSDAEARRHLEGRQTAGIYPLLADGAWTGWQNADLWLLTTAPFLVAPAGITCPTTARVITQSEPDAVTAEERRR
jgi:hypothetical protein